MITPYVQAVGGALGGVLSLFTELALPLAVLLGLAALAATWALVVRRSGGGPVWPGWGESGSRFLGYTAVGLLAITGWAALGAALPMARGAIEWKASAEATSNPVPDASPVFQPGPVVGAISEHTYRRTLTLPPDFLQRVGEQGVGVLAPYLTDPSAENVLRLSDTFRRSGSDVVFTREVTRLDEQPIPFDDGHVQVTFHRLSGRAYDAEFEGRYLFTNSGTEPITARFLFSLPSAGTVRDLSVQVGENGVPEPNQSGTYEWKGELKAGEQREAIVRYRVIGASTWNYDLGSQRRRVRQFHLVASPDGPVRFQRGSLQPSDTTRQTVKWDLGSVVTAQQIAIAFPPDIAGRESYLQALSALPITFLLFLGGVILLGLLLRRRPAPGRLAAAAVLFALGLGASTVLANYLGSAAAILLAPLPAVYATARLLGRPALLAALPAALLPATFLSGPHTGLLILLLAVLTGGAAYRLLSTPRRTFSPAG
jgi:hypothetical protein